VDEYFVTFWTFCENFSPLSSKANGKIMLYMCFHSVLLLGKSDVFCTKKLFSLITPCNLRCVLQKTLEIFDLIFFFLRFLAKIWCFWKYLTLCQGFRPPDKHWCVLQDKNLMFSARKFLKIFDSSWQTLMCSAGRFLKISEKFDPFLHFQPFWQDNFCVLQNI